MTNEQKAAFDADLNRLLGQYHLKMIGAVYFSKVGTGSVDGVAVAGCNTGSMAQHSDPDQVNGLEMFSLLQRLNDLQESL